MKTFLVTLAVFIAGTSLAVTTKLCRISEVIEKNNIWKEGVGVYGLESTDSDSNSVRLASFKGKLTAISLGQVHWSKKHHQIRQEKDQVSGAIRYFIDSRAGHESMQFRLYPSQRGVALLKEKGGDPQWRLVANFDCMETETVAKAAIGHWNVQELKPTNYRQLTAKVREQMDKVDLPSELGDGYYDLLSHKFFRVVNRNSAVIGYLYWARLQFIDSSESEYFVRFDRSGLRLSEEPEKLN